MSHHEKTISFSKFHGLVFCVINTLARKFRCVSVSVVKESWPVILGLYNRGPSFFCRNKTTSTRTVFASNQGKAFPLVEHQQKIVWIVCEESDWDEKEIVCVRVLLLKWCFHCGLAISCCSGQEPMHLCSGQLSNQTTKKNLFQIFVKNHVLLRR